MTTTTSAFLSVPTIPHKLSPPKQRLNGINTNRWSSNAQTSSPNFIRCCSNSNSNSNSNSTSVAEEEKQGVSLSESMPTIDSNSLRGCKGCGREEIENGCNGEGRIQGGIATVPGFGWWPIKAYRPCPGFVASGGRYTRRGQSMDEVAGFGKVGRGAPMGTNDEA